MDKICNRRREICAGVVVNPPYGEKVRQRLLASIAILTLAVAGCSPDRVLPPTEVAEKSDAIHNLVWQHQKDLESDVIDEGSLRTLDDTLQGVAQRYGYRSPEMSQALMEVVSLLAQCDRYDLALPYMEQTLEVTRAYYGLQHRETAFALHDLALVLSEIDREHRVPRAELLFRSAADVRRRLLGPDHGETAASETQLAWQLLLGARTNTWEPSRSRQLQEAEQLALHARDAFDAQKDASYELQVRRIGLETAFASNRLEDAEARAREIVSCGDYALGPGLYPQATAFDLLLQVLRAQQRGAEADLLEADRQKKSPEQELFGCAAAETPV